MARAQQTPDDSVPALPPLPVGTRIAAVVSTFHAELTRAMCASAQRELATAGVAEEDFLVLDAPGAFELPILARRLAIREDIAAVLCFGLVLKGETTHDRYVAGAAARGILDVSLQTDKPVLFGVLTCDTLEQARARALSPEDSGDDGTHDKGREVARAAVMTLAGLDGAAGLGLVHSPMGFLGGGPDGSAQ